MPYVGNKRKKNRTHKTEPEGGAQSERVPKSFVLRRGKVDRGVRELVEDMREVMLPHTASRLRERKLVLHLAKRGWGLRCFGHR
jgi:ribosome biogenesis protein SSF1/2